MSHTLTQGRPTPSPYQTTTPSTNHSNSSAALGGILVHDGFNPFQALNPATARWFRADCSRKMGSRLQIDVRDVIPHRASPWLERLSAMITPKCLPFVSSHFRSSSLLAMAATLVSLLLAHVGNTGTNGPGRSGSRHSRRSTSSRSAGDETVVFRSTKRTSNSWDARLKTVSALCFLEDRSLSQFLRFWSSSGGSAGCSRSSRTAKASESPRPSPLAASASQRVIQEYSLDFRSLRSYTSRSTSTACGLFRFHRYLTADQSARIGHILAVEHLPDGGRRKWGPGPDQGVTPVRGRNAGFQLGGDAILGLIAELEHRSGQFFTAKMLPEVGPARDQLIGRGETRGRARVARASQQVANLRGPIAAALQANLRCADLNELQTFQIADQPCAGMSTAASECWRARAMSGSCS